MVQQTLIFPILLLAGVLLPLEGTPRWVQILGDLNPLTYVVEGVRALFAGRSMRARSGSGFLAAGLIAALGLAVGLRTMRRSS